MADSEAPTWSTFESESAEDKSVRSYSSLGSDGHTIYSQRVHCAEGGLLIDVEDDPDEDTATGEDTAVGDHPASSEVLKTVAPSSPPAFGPPVANLGDFERPCWNWSGHLVSGVKRDVELEQHRAAILSGLKRDRSTFEQTCDKGAGKGAEPTDRNSNSNSDSDLEAWVQAELDDMFSPDAPSPIQRLRSPSFGPPVPKPAPPVPDLTPFLVPWPTCPRCDKTVCWCICADGPVVAAMRRDARRELELALAAEDEPDDDFRPLPKAGTDTGPPKALAAGPTP